MLVAMATGTGKTKLAIALLYRLLNAKRFRRVCFVVDRSALGEQTGGEFSHHQGRRDQDLRRHLRSQGSGGHRSRAGNQGPHLHHPGPGAARALYRRPGGRAAHRPVRPDRDRRVPPRLSARPRDVRRRAELPQRGGLHLQIPPRAGALRRGQDRPDRHARAAYRADLRRSDLHLLLPRGGDRRLSDRPRAADPDHDRPRPGRHSLRARASSCDCSTPRPARSIWPTPRTRSLSRSRTSTSRSSPINFNQVVAEELAKHIDPDLARQDPHLRRHRRPCRHRGRSAEEGVQRDATARSRTPRSARSPAAWTRSAP